MMSKGLLWIATTVAMAAIAAAQSQTPPLPEGEGKKILEAACTVCHSLREVTKFSGFYSRENWRDIVETMIADGAVLKDAEVPALIEYLTNTFPKNFPDGDGKKLLDTACSGCHSITNVRRFDGFYTKTEWDKLVRGMVAKGAPLQEDQASALVDYLADTFPPLRNSKN